MRIVCVTGFWVLLGKAGSFDELTSVILVVAGAAIVLLHRKDASRTGRSLSLVSLMFVVAAIIFTSWVGTGTLENSTGAAWLVLGGLSAKGPLLSLLGASAFWSIRTAFRGLSV
jgi:hypothetical protein